MNKKYFSVLVITAVLFLGFSFETSASFLDEKTGLSEENKVLLYQEQRRDFREEVTYSLILPGSGHVRFGEWKKGLAYSFGELLCLHSIFKSEQENSETYIGVFLLLKAMEIGDLKRIVDDYNHQLLEEFDLVINKGGMKVGYSVDF